MTERPHIVEANHMRPVRFFSEHELPATETYEVVSSDCFPSDRDSPDPEDRVVVAAGENVIRGKVVEIVFLIEADRS